MLRSIRTVIAAFGRLVRDRRGATAVEYGLIIALIVLAMFAALNGFAGASVRMWNNVSTKVLSLA